MPMTWPYLVAFPGRSFRICLTFLELPIRFMVGFEMVDLLLFEIICNTVSQEAQTSNLQWGDRKFASAP